MNNSITDTGIIHDRHRELPARDPLSDRQGREPQANRALVNRGSDRYQTKERVGLYRNRQSIRHHDESQNGDSNHDIFSATESQSMFMTTDTGQPPAKSDQKPTESLVLWGNKTTVDHPPTRLSSLPHKHTWQATFVTEPVRQKGGGVGGIASMATSL